ncbi:MAG: hypothetical protein ACREPI_04380, partial [Candidatus Dormibacterales bacterium]
MARGNEPELEDYAVSPEYQGLPPTAPVPAPDDYLERLVREGAQKALQVALEQEVEEFLGRLRYERSAEFRGHRNGHLPARQIGVGMSSHSGRTPRALIHAVAAAWPSSWIATPPSPAPLV